MDWNCPEVHMRDTTRAETLLSLFTSSDCAAAIAGDLTEEQPHRGSSWFWQQVLRTTLALWRSAMTDAPLTVLMLAVTGCLLLITPLFGGVAALYLVPGSPVRWIALPLFWWGGALWTGASLVHIAPRSGMTACLTLALAAQALLIGFGVNVLWHEPQHVEIGRFYAIGLAATAPLLLGGAIARRRQSAVDAAAFSER
jgi:hypothetical protein